MHTSSFGLAVIGEELVVIAEDDNEHDDYAVAVIKDGCVVGHVPRSISKVSWFFLKRGSHTLCRVTGNRKRGVGLEVPCVYTYSGSTKNVEKLKRLLDDSEITNTLSLPSS